ELYRSLSKPAFVRALQKLVPEIRQSDLVPGGAGVRAQAVSASGALVDDFVIKESRNAIHVLNAPSPGATASLAIGRAITEMAAKNYVYKNSPTRIDLVSSPPAFQDEYLSTHPPPTDPTVRQTRSNIKC